MSNELLDLFFGISEKKLSDTVSKSASFFWSKTLFRIAFFSNLSSWQWHHKGLTIHSSGCRWVSALSSLHWRGSLDNMRHFYVCLSSRSAHECAALGGGIDVLITRYGWVWPQLRNFVGLKSFSGSSFTNMTSVFSFRMGPVGFFFQLNFACACCWASSASLKAIDFSLDILRWKKKEVETIWKERAVQPDMNQWQQRLARRKLR